MKTETGDKALALLAAKGDGDAFAALLDRHYDTVFRVAYRFCGHREEAEDIAQDVCVSLPQRLKHYRGDGAFTTWLYAVVVNRAKDVRRKQVTQNRKHIEYADLETLQRGEAEAAQREGEWLDEMLSRLPEELRQTAVLVVGEGLSQQEASTVLGVKEGTVAWRMSELKKALRAFAQEEGMSA